MKSGWTGGQYSVVRALLGAYLLWFFARIMVLDESISDPVFALSLLGADPVFARWLVPLVGCLAATLLLLGRLDRTAAWLLFFLTPWRPDLFSPAALVSPLHFLLALHLFVPPAPYGSLAAAGRPDPAGAWQMPRPVPLAATLFLATTYFSGGLMDIWSFVNGQELARLTRTVPDFWREQSQFIQDATRISWSVLGLGFALLIWARKLRPILWLCFFLIHLALALITPGGFVFLIVYAFAFQPAWLPAQPADEAELVFYDGQCGLCHRIVRFVLSEDADGSLFRLSPLQGETFMSKIAPEHRANLPDSSALLTRDGVFTAQIGGGPDRDEPDGAGYGESLGTIGRLVPRPIRDLVYDAIARIRFFLFRKPDNVCPILPPRLRSRFMF